MSLELGQPADGDQAVSADEAEETRSPEGATVPSFTETADTSDAPEAADTSDAPDNIDKVDAWDASEDSDAADAPDTSEPDTPETADAYEPSDHEAASGDEPLADSGAPGAAEPSVLDDAAGAPATGPSFTPADEETLDGETLDGETLDGEVVDGETLDGEVVAGEVVAGEPVDEEATPVSRSSTPGDPAAPAGSAARLEEAAGDLDGPLLGDAASLRTNWQQILAGFVDDPREAVADAAVLVDHTAQALVGALQARQRLLRAMWDRDAAPDGLGTSGIGAPTGAHAAGASRADDALDTEELRLLIQRYRTLFNDICRS